MTTIAIASRRDHTPCLQSKAKRAPVLGPNLLMNRPTLLRNYFRSRRDTGASVQPFTPSQANTDWQNAYQPALDSRRSYGPYKQFNGHQICFGVFIPRLVKVCVDAIQVGLVFSRLIRYSLCQRNEADRDRRKEHPGHRYKRADEHYNRESQYPGQLQEQDAD
jgi:hypothetical protein